MSNDNSRRDYLCKKLRNLYVQNGTDYVQEAADAIRQLEADSAALRQDALRYRFLRNDECDTIGVESDNGTGNWEFIAGNDLDAAIDAMREGKEKE